MHVTDTTSHNVESVILSSLSSTDHRYSMSTDDIAYKNLFSFRQKQHELGAGHLNSLVDEQWGLAYIEKCHHISTTSTSKDSPPSFRVRICKSYFK